ncbi:CCNL1-like protein [Mya arenaria]|uniref:CCNL1-like protein n=1 Tax=Mya arenaria TaxID=6604 RepID=A0ABY7EZQ5_MYAAR|nr:CCNL1-like protein [Mya arenaria]
MAEVTEQKPGATMERDFSTIILTLENVLIPDEKLSPTPSLLDGLDLDTETDLRILGCELIQTAGILLKLPQVAMATGQVLFQRFYYSKSFVKHNMEVLAMACINLASKIEECPRRIRDVINTFHHVKQIRNKKNIHPLVLDQNYINLKNQVIKAERRVLKELGFCVHVKHPHKVIVMFLQVLDANQNQKLVQCACKIVVKSEIVILGGGSQCALKATINSTALDQSPAFHRLSARRPVDALAKISRNVDGGKENVQTGKSSLIDGTIFVRWTTCEIEGITEA